MVKVKICGITNLRDAQQAVAAGADAIGLVFAESPRRVTLSQARQIAKAVGPWVSTFGVFVNEKPETMRRIAAECRLSGVQLHGDEKPSELRKMNGLKVIKAFRIRIQEDLSAVKLFEADAFLFDTKSETAYGGTGKSFDWSLLKDRKFSRPVILSGGLDPANVRSAVKAVLPYGVDVSSGVERSPGKKDARLVREFIRNAKK